MVYEQWSYRRAILITENSGSDLSDYAVKITLDSSNFDSWDKVNPDGSDIRFTDDQGNPLSYWIEKFDSVNQEAIIWVKIPILQANAQVTIYMYYGNPNAVSEANGDDVFSFFDDFEDGVIDTSKWNIIGSGVSESNGTVIFSPESGAWCGIVSKNSFQPIKVSFVAKFVQRQSTELQQWISDYMPSGNPYPTKEWYRHMDSSDYYSIQRYTDPDGSCVTLVEETKEYSLPTVFEIRSSGSIIRFYTGNNQQYAGAISGTFPSVYLILGSWSSLGQDKVDYCYLRKYTDPEPSVTIMSEEYIGATISVYDSLLIQNAYVSLQRVLETSILVSDYLLVQNAEISLIRALEPVISVSDLIAVKSADISLVKSVEPTILVSDSLLVKNANIDLIRALEPTILVSNSLLVKNAYISISRSLEPVISVSDSLLVKNAYIKLIREISPSISVSDSLLINNAYIQMLASSEPFITVRDSILVNNAYVSIQRLLEPVVLFSDVVAVRNATITLQKTKEVVTKPTEVPYKELLLFGSVLGALYLLSKKKEREEYEVSYY